MPIRPENRRFYGPEWRRIRAEILLRAKNRCERCGRPDGVTVMVGDDGVWGDRLDCIWRDEHGLVTDSPSRDTRLVKTVLTIAHLDHDPTNNDPANLRALCQRCHLRHDAAQHAANARQTRRSRKAVRDLFGDGECPVLECNAVLIEGPNLSHADPGEMIRIEAGECVPLRSPDHCPRCDSLRWEAEVLDVDDYGTPIQVRVTCHDCGNVWNIE